MAAYYVIMFALSVIAWIIVVATMAIVRAFR